MGTYLPVSKSSYWSVETGEWSADGDSGTLILTPSDESAVLRIDTICAWAPPWHEMLAQAKRRAPEGAVIKETSFGPFSGVEYEGRDAQGDYWREWLLSLGELYLLVSYSCAYQDRHRDRDLINRLLATLADGRA
jgi:hypothetical protein